jgi:hypothetical protein
MRSTSLAVAVIGRAMLEHRIGVARESGYSRLDLETCGWESSCQPDRGAPPPASSGVSRLLSTEPAGTAPT